MIKEEYAYSDLEDYLTQSVDLLIAGYPGTEERSCFFYNKWYNGNKDVLLIRRTDNESACFKLISNQETVFEDKVDLCIGLPRVLNLLDICTKNVLLDMASLDHVLIMFLTKQLLTSITPRALFAAYIRPNQYISESGTIGYALSEQIRAIEAVPGFAKRETDNQILCAFLGFEGIRLKNVLETVHSIEKLVPIVAFPSSSPQWYKVTMWNSMDVLQSEAKNLAIYKCLSESVFDAVNVLNEIISQDDTVVLAPLGTRPHSMACAIFACKHQATRIIYDFVLENEHRAVGISGITIYHLSSFIQS